VTAYQPPPTRHWRRYGDDKLPTPAEAMGEPFAAFPSWFMRIECDRCGKVRMVNEVHTPQRAMSIRDIIAACRGSNSALDPVRGCFCPRLWAVPRGHHEVGEPAATIRAAVPQLGQRHVAAAGVHERLEVRVGLMPACLAPHQHADIAT
jgi:hypothetical protein